MKMAEAIEMMKEPVAGFMVNFEHAGDGFLRGDYFPDKRAGEPLISTESEAWRLAEKFAAKTEGTCINIYVTDQDFRPTLERTITNR